jgi:ABC-2 type transport system ATP-binding protein
MSGSAEARSGRAGRTAAAPPVTESVRAAPPPARLSGATVQYGAVRALDGVDLMIEPARVTVLLGPNGAGKTTAIRLLLGLLAPTHGTVRVFGGDPRIPVVRARTGAMLQVSKVPETLRVSEHIDAFRAYYPRPLSRAELVDAAGLRGLERRLFGTLSGGEKQRVLFALALAGDPSLLFLDEPTVGMDVETRRSFWRRIRSLRDSGRAVLLTTHYLEEADALADRVVVLDRGRIVADGSPAQVRRTVALRRIRCVTNLPVADIRDIDGVVSAACADGAVVITTRDAEHVVRALFAMDGSMHDLEVAGASLEDAFLALTGGAAAEPVRATADTPVYLHPAAVTDVTETVRLLEGEP